MAPAPRTSRVAVVGGGIAGLTAAWDLARSGAEVTVYEAGSRLGGAVAPHVLAGVRCDAGAEAFATRTTAVRQLIEDLGLAEQVVSPNPAGAWLQIPGLAAPLPATGLLGIPGDPQAEDVRRLIGAEAAARAAQDLHRPVDQWRGVSSPTVGQVARDRMGDVVVDALVSPITSGVHSADPDELDMNTAAPGLFSAMLEEGSLARAVQRLKAQAPAGSAVQSLHGGMATLVDALEAALRQAGVTIHVNHRVTDLRGLAADRLLLAVDGPAALELLGPVLPQLEGEGFSDGGTGGVALVSMVVHAPELDAHPRGTGMLVAPSVTEIGAKAMSHASAKWAWAADALTAVLGSGHHLVRLSYGRITDTPDSPTLGFQSSDEQLLAAAAADLPQLTGVPIGPEQILDADVVRWERALPAASAGHLQRVQQLRQALSQQRQLPQGEAGTKIWTAGSWFAGTGLARVIPDARAVAARMLEN
ncbi:protoporphyrinogen oxidase [Nesterenkonia massiliensis]|uniref:Coproporphyrinogen III oxidase n=2 Tax=Nesterenkonia massiliensis TaxID=1232429 RepID=A0ABT2HRP9_9MICC|nr:protoporphyrinogen oxidase [Nesterenkonia massiliensis]